MICAIIRWLLLIAFIIIRSDSAIGTPSFGFAEPRFANKASISDRVDKALSDGSHLFDNKPIVPELGQQNLAPHHIHEEQRNLLGNDVDEADTPSEKNDGEELDLVSGHQQNIGNDETIIYYSNATLPEAIYNPVQTLAGRLVLQRLLRVLVKHLDDRDLDYFMCFGSLLSSIRTY